MSCWSCLVVGESDYGVYVTGEVGVQSVDPHGADPIHTCQKAL